MAADHAELLLELKILRDELAEERSRLSRIAALLGLAPYGGAYNPDRVEIAVAALLGALRDARRVQTSTTK